MNIRTSTDSGDRRLTQRYLILDEEHERTDRDEIHRPAFEISTSHHKDRKAFLVTYSRILVGQRFVRWAMELRNEDPLPDIPGGYWVPVPRYSQKELERVHADAIARFEHLPKQGRENVYLWATRAKG